MTVVLINPEYRTVAHPTGRCSRCGAPIQPGQLWLVRTAAHVACRELNSSPLTGVVPREYNDRKVEDPS